MNNYKFIFCNVIILQLGFFFCAKAENVTKIDTIHNVTKDTYAVIKYYGDEFITNEVAIFFYSTLKNDSLINMFKGKPEFGGYKFEIYLDDEYLVVKDGFDGTGHYATYNTDYKIYKYIDLFKNWINIGTISYSEVFTVYGLEETYLSPGRINVGLLGCPITISSDSKELVCEKYQDILDEKLKMYQNEIQENNLNEINFHTSYNTLEFLTFIPELNQKIETLADCLFKTNRFDEARYVYQNLKDTPKTLLRLGDIAWYNNKEDALGYYKQYLIANNVDSTSNQYLQVQTRVDITENLISNIMKCMSVISKDCGMCWNDNVLIAIECLEWCKDITRNNVVVYNDLAYYLEQYGLYGHSIDILNTVIKSFPSRTVAYINLGDAYWGLKETDHAKHAYQKYIELMKDNGKESKIPDRIFDRIKD